MQQIFQYSVTDPMALILISLVLGTIAAVISSKCFHQNNSVTIALILLPPLVCAALQAINGNIGASIGVMGVFSLVRFRSAQGTARDIVSVFYAMTVGLITVTGQVVTAAAVTLLVGAVIVVSSAIINRNCYESYLLKILIPEQLNIDGAFDDIFRKYFTSCELDKVKTTNMGAMFELNYKVCPVKNIKVKDMLDEIRSRNANLTVAYCKSDTQQDIL